MIWLNALIFNFTMALKYEYFNASKIKNIIN